jgi:hypothetical protein
MSELTSNAKSTDDHMMQARSLLRQAKCPECGCRGMAVDAEGCAWCQERERVQAFMLQGSAHEPEVIRSEERQRCINAISDRSTFSDADVYADAIAAIEAIGPLPTPPPGDVLVNVLPKITPEIVLLLWGSDLIESEGPGEKWNWSQSAVDFACLLNKGLNERRSALTKCAKYDGVCATHYPKECP